MLYSACKLRFYHLAVVYPLFSLFVIDKAVILAYCFCHNYGSAYLIHYIVSGLLFTGTQIEACVSHYIYLGRVRCFDLYLGPRKIIFYIFKAALIKKDCKIISADPAYNSIVTYNFLKALDKSAHYICTHVSAYLLIYRRKMLEIEVHGGIAA